ncbi:hypothetical protein BH23ACT9_BH23ACT9_23520 [soil metagenome]
MPQQPQPPAIRWPGESQSGNVAAAFGLSAQPEQEGAFDAGLREIEKAEREAENLAGRTNRGPWQTRCGAGTRPGRADRHRPHHRPHHAQVAIDQCA